MLRRRYVRFDATFTYLFHDATRRQLLFSRAGAAASPLFSPCCFAAERATDISAASFLRLIVMPRFSLLCRHYADVSVYFRRHSLFAAAQMLTPRRCFLAPRCLCLFAAATPPAPDVFASLRLLMCLSVGRHVALMLLIYVPYGSPPPVAFRHVFDAG